MFRNLGFVNLFTQRRLTRFKKSKINYDWKYKNFTDGETSRHNDRRIDGRTDKRKDPVTKDPSLGLKREDHPSIKWMKLSLGCFLRVIIRVNVNGVGVGR